jgi:hypothetical protein
MSTTQEITMKKQRFYSRNSSIQDIVHPQKCFVQSIPSYLFLLRTVHVVINCVWAVSVEKRTKI